MLFQLTSTPTQAKVIQSPLRKSSLGQSTHDTTATFTKVLDSINTGDYLAARDGCKRLATQHHAKAMGLLGLLHKTACDKGEFPNEFSYAEAERLLKLASDKEVPAATCELGMWKFQEKKFADARDYLNKLNPLHVAPSPDLSAERLIEANRALGTIYGDGSGVERDLTLAEQHYQYGADKEDVQSQFLLGYLQLFVCQPPKITSGRHYLQLAANKSHVEAARQLGEYDSQLGNKETAKTNFIPAVGFQHPAANYQMGQYNPLTLYEGAVRMGFPIIGENLQDLHQTSSHVQIAENARYYPGYVVPGNFDPKNVHAQLLLLQALADKNHIGANFWLGDYYARQGCTQIAKAYFEKASSLGNPCASWLLGNYFADNAQPHIAAQRYQKALDQGMAPTPPMIEYIRINSHESSTVNLAQPA